jgi:anti-sigma factor RsiW
MSSDMWRSKIEAYADGELSANEARAMAEHLRDCPSCTLDMLGRVQLKRAVKTAGIALCTEPCSKTARGAKPPRRKRQVGMGPELDAKAGCDRRGWLCLVFALLRGWSSYQQQQTFAELADLHVATLASSTPVDVISTDRHTVKPWFEGKIPFSFNLPELGGSPYTLLGGRLSYLGQAPGAQLIFQVGKHRISVFIFQDRVDRLLTSGDSISRRLTFNVETFSDDGLRYFVIGDASADDIRQLGEMLKAAARS